MVKTKERKDKDTMAYIMFDDNQVVITGKIAMDFTFSHKICGECFL